MPRNPPIDPKLQRREAALRANLARRKAQERARDDPAQNLSAKPAEVIEPNPDLP